MKTHRDILTQILSEVTGKPSEQINSLMAMIQATTPDNKLDDPVSDEYYEEMLTGLRKEGPAILNKLIKGGISARKQIEKQGFISGPNNVRIYDITEEINKASNN